MKELYYGLLKLVPRYTNLLICPSLTVMRGFLRSTLIPYGFQYEVYPILAISFV